MYISFICACLLAVLTGKTCTSGNGNAAPGTPKHCDAFLAAEGTGKAEERIRSSGLPNRAVNCSMRP
jgi:hypothetical protein